MSVKFTLGQALHSRQYNEYCPAICQPKLKGLEVTRKGESLKVLLKHSRPNMMIRLYTILVSVQQHTTLTVLFPYHGL